MGELICEGCGRSINKSVAQCPHCGQRRRSALSRVWVLVFFVLGIVMGLLLLILQQGEAPSWLTLEWPQSLTEQAEPKTKSVIKPIPQRKSDKVMVRPSLGTQSTTVTVEPMRCNREKAQAVWDKGRSLASIRVQDEVLQLRMGRDWEYYSPGHRRGFVEAFSEADHCLQGYGRAIHFSFQGKEVATVTAEGAVVLK